MKSTFSYLSYMFIIHYQYCQVKRYYSWAVCWRCWCTFNVFLCNLHLWWMTNIDLIHLADLWSRWLASCKTCPGFSWMNWSLRSGPEKSLKKWQLHLWDGVTLLSKMKCCQCHILCCKETSQQKRHAQYL